LIKSHQSLIIFLPTPLLVMHFTLSCSATLSVFIARNIPIFLSIDDRPRAGNYGKKDTMFSALIRFIQEWKRYNRSLNELSRLGDRELADIGISRSDIPRVAWTASQRG
jgi:uncharacterized protein YjiS (DUF1127 family)